MEKQKCEPASPGQALGLGWDPAGQAGSELAGQGIWADLSLAPQCEELVKSASPHMSELCSVPAQAGDFPPMLTLRHMHVQVLAEASQPWDRS